MAERREFLFFLRSSVVYVLINIIREKNLTTVICFSAFNECDLIFIIEKARFQD